MPKQKTNRGAAKRFQLTKNGKIKRQKAYASHLLTHKSSKRKRRLRKADIAHPADEARIRRMLVA